jgi:hypothetical protein
MQVHGNQVVDAVDSAIPLRADGAFTGKAGVVCSVLTADCLPLLLCDGAGERVAAVHAGWRGLAAGVVEQGVVNCWPGWDRRSVPLPTWWVMRYGPPLTTRTHPRPLRLPPGVAGMPTCMPLLGNGLPFAG